jgi:putative hydrolase
MSPRQRELVSRLQALMSLLEGYSNHVMNAVGRGLLPHLDEIEHRVEARSRQRGAAELLFLRLTGLQMKLDQYRLGAAFVNRVNDDRGIAFMNQVWEGPEKLPTEDEIRDPAQWMRRMDQVLAR